MRNGAGMHKSACDVEAEAEVCRGRSECVPGVIRREMDFKKCRTVCGVGGKD